MAIGDRTNLQLDNIPAAGDSSDGPPTDEKSETPKKEGRQRFEILRKLGSGTYGKVSLARDHKTGEEVAVKIIKKSAIESEQDLMRIRREIRIMSALSHPNIIDIKEVFENREKIIIIMEYASGGELYDYVSTRGAMPEEESRRVFRQIVSAVFYIHKHHVAHRDLKLENILLDGSLNAKIADFGLSNYFAEKSLLKTFCGSPLYASPEIINGTPYVGPEVDCWSLGVLLYSLAYGSMPFDGRDFNRMARQIRRGLYYEPDMPSSASMLIRTMLRVDATRRADIDDIASHWWLNFSTEELVPLQDLPENQVVDPTPLNEREDTMTVQALGNESDMFAEYTFLSLATRKKLEDFRKRKQDAQLDLTNRENTAPGVSNLYRRDYGDPAIRKTSYGTTRKTGKSKMESIDPLERLKAIEARLIDIVNQKQLRTPTADDHGLPGSSAVPGSRLRSARRGSGGSGAPEYSSSITKKRRTKRRGKSRDQTPSSPSASKSEAQVKSEDKESDVVPPVTSELSGNDRAIRESEDTAVTSRASSLMNELIDASSNGPIPQQLIDKVQATPESKVKQFMQEMLDSVVEETNKAANGADPANGAQAAPEAAMDTKYDASQNQNGRSEGAARKISDDLPDVVSGGSQGITTPTSAGETRTEPVSQTGTCNDGTGKQPDLVASSPEKVQIRLNVGPRPRKTDGIKAKNEITESEEESEDEEEEEEEESSGSDEFALYSQREDIKYSPSDYEDLDDEDDDDNSGKPRPRMDSLLPPLTDGTSGTDSYSSALSHFEEKAGRNGTEPQRTNTTEPGTAPADLISEDPFSRSLTKRTSRGKYGYGQPPKYGRSISLDTPSSDRNEAKGRYKQFSLQDELSEDTDSADSITPTPTTLGRSPMVLSTTASAKADFTVQPPISSALGKKRTSLGQSSAGAPVAGYLQAASLYPKAFATGPMPPAPPRRFGLPESRLKSPEPARQAEEDPTDPNSYEALMKECAEIQSSRRMPHRYGVKLNDPDRYGLVSRAKSYHTDRISGEEGLESDPEPYAYRRPPYRGPLPDGGYPTAPYHETSVAPPYYGVGRYETAHMHPTGYMGGAAGGVYDHSPFSPYGPHDLAGRPFSGYREPVRHRPETAAYRPEYLGRPSGAIDGRILTSSDRAKARSLHELSMLPGDNETATDIKHAGGESKFGGRFGEPAYAGTDYVYGDSQPAAEKADGEVDSLWHRRSKPIYEDTDGPSYGRKHDYIRRRYSDISSKPEGGKGYTPLTESVQTTSHPIGTASANPYIGPDGTYIPRDYSSPGYKPRIDENTGRPRSDLDEFSRLDVRDHASITERPSRYASSRDKEVTRKRSRSLERELNEQDSGTTYTSRREYGPTERALSPEPRDRSQPYLSYRFHDTAAHDARPRASQMGGGAPLRGILKRSSDRSEPGAYTVTPIVDHRGGTYGYDGGAKTSRFVDRMRERLDMGEKDDVDRMPSKWRPSYTSSYRGDDVGTNVGSSGSSGYGSGNADTGDMDDKQRKRRGYLKFSKRSFSLGDGKGVSSDSSMDDENRYRAGTTSGPSSDKTRGYYGSSRLQNRDTTGYSPSSMGTNSRLYTSSFGQSDTPSSRIGSHASSSRGASSYQPYSGGSTVSSYRSSHPYTRATPRHWYDDTTKY